MSRMAFEQARIPVQKTEEFERLRAAVERAFAAGAVEKLLARVQGNGISVREFEKVLDGKVLEALDSSAARPGQSARQLYDALTLSDQALMREFYLERLEQVDAGIRQKFQKVYQYY
jgi:hypothetical protein